MTQTKSPEDNIPQLIGRLKALDWRYAITNNRADLCAVRAAALAIVAECDNRLGTVAMEPNTTEIEQRLADLRAQHDELVSEGEDYEAVETWLEIQALEQKLGDAYAREWPGDTSPLIQCEGLQDTEDGFLNAFNPIFDNVGGVVIPDDDWACSLMYAEEAMPGGMSQWKQTYYSIRRGLTEQYANYIRPEQTAGFTHAYLDRARSKRLMYDDPAFPGGYDPVLVPAWTLVKQVRENRGTVAMLAVEPGGEMAAIWSLHWTGEGTWYLDQIMLPDAQPSGDPIVTGDWDRIAVNVAALTLQWGQWELEDRDTF